MKNISFLIHFENFFKLASALIAVLLASKLYSTSDFGKISYLISFLVIANAIAEGGFGQLILTKQKIFKGVSHPMSSLFALRLISTVIVILLFNFLFLFLPLDFTEKNFLSCSIFLSLFGFFILLRQDLVNELKVKTLIIAGIFSSTIATLLKLLSSILQVEPIFYVLISAFCIAVTGLIYLTFFCTAKYLEKGLSRIEFIDFRKRFKKLIDIDGLLFSMKNLKPFYFASLASVMFTYSDVLILKFYTNFDTVAFYSLSQQFCGAAISFSPGIVSMYASQNFIFKKIKAVNVDHLTSNALHSYLRNTLLVSSVFFATCGFLFLLLTNQLVLENRYELSIYFFLSSLPLIIITYMQQGFSLLLQQSGMEKLIYIISFSALIFNLIFNFVTIPWAGAFGAIFSTTISIVLSILVPLSFKSSRSDYFSALSCYSWI